MKLQGNVTDMTLTEFTDKRIGFGLNVKFPEYECPVHGSVGTTGGIIFAIPNRPQRIFCWSCIEDKIIAAGVCELTEVKE